MQLPQLLLVTKVDGQRGWGYQVTRLPVDIGHAVTSVTIGYQGGWSKRLGLPSYQVTSRYWTCSYLSYYWLPRWMIKEAGVTKLPGYQTCSYLSYKVTRCAVTSVTIGYQGGWSKRLGLPSYQLQVTSRSMLVMIISSMSCCQWSNGSGVTKLPSRYIQIQSE